MVISTLFLIKFVVTVLFVLILSMVAEHVSPKVSGIISGIPTGTAIILFFYALEQGTKFASESSVFNLVGMLSLQVFLYLYFRFSGKNTKLNIFLSSFAAIAGYFVIIFLLKQFNFILLTALIVPLVSIPLFYYLLKRIKDSKIKHKVKISAGVLFLRAMIASVVILTVTETARIVGPEWAGLFSAFPTTLFPLILIIHSTYGKEHVHTIIKNVPRGQFAMVIYIIGVFFLYPLLGVYWGTLISYSFVLAYLLLLFKSKFLSFLNIFFS